MVMLKHHTFGKFSLCHKSKKDATSIMHIHGLCLFLICTRSKLSMYRVCIRRDLLYSIFCAFCGENIIRQSSQTVCLSVMANGRCMIDGL